MIVLSQSGHGLLQVKKGMGRSGTTTTTWASPYFMVSCPGTQAVTTQSMTAAEYESIAAAAPQYQAPARPSVHRLTGTLGRMRLANDWT